MILAATAQVLSQERRSPIAALTVRVRAVTREAEDILGFELAPVDGHELPRFTAGSHVDVHIREGLKRPYSLCNDPRERGCYSIAVLKEKNGLGGSKAMHEEIKAGAKLTISAPRNNFPLAGPEAERHLLLAGGIGVTPMMAMIAELEDRGASWRMHYCTRALERTAFRARLAPRIAAGKVLLHHDGGDPARGLDIKAALARHEPGTHVYVCGPAGFMNAARAALAHWPAECVHWEYFTPAAGAPAENQPFQIKIKATGAVLDVPADRSIIAVLRAHGFEIETDCEQGYCGTCITPLLAGEAEHRDTVLSEQQRKNYLMICCARAKGGMLVIDP
jgi:vanillate O-demethylase ferredoxin subunit